MSEWDDPIAASKVQFRNMTFDSKLELNWWLTLERLGFDLWDHPGRIDLRDGGWWEPDLRVGEVLCEIKPWSGESTEREWKPRAAADEHQLPVLILRPGLMPIDASVEQAGCDWESCDGQEWVMVLEPGQERFEPLSSAEKYLSSGYVRFAASSVMSDTSGLRSGVPMRHWSEVREAIRSDFLD